MGEPLLEVRDLSCGYGDVEVVHGLSFDLEPGDFFCLMGANGCGKTTTMKTIMQLLRPLGGSVVFAGERLDKMSHREVARRVAYIPQAHSTPFAFRVADVVLMGRTPYLGNRANASDYDKRIAHCAVQIVGIEDLLDKSFDQLSGGQQQLVLIARALAQQPRLLAMDEPTGALDFGNQQLVLRCMRSLADRGIAILMVTHDPNQVLAFADRVAIMEEGRLVASGTPSECLTSQMLDRIYGAPARIIELSEEGCQSEVCVPVVRR